MSDPVAEIRHLLQRYQEAMSSGDVATLGDLHWQDGRFIHVGAAGTDAGWGAYEVRLQEHFGDGAPGFQLSDLRIEVFHGKFGAASAAWERSAAGGREPAAGTATFVLSKMGSSWKIVADHHTAAAVAGR